MRFVAALMSNLQGKLSVGGSLENKERIKKKGSVFNRIIFTF
jgi:hypothetical protein